MQVAQLKRVGDDDDDDDDDDEDEDKNDDDDDDDDYECDCQRLLVWRQFSLKLGFGSSKPTSLNQLALKIICNKIALSILNEKLFRPGPKVNVKVKVNVNLPPRAC